MAHVYTKKSNNNMDLEGTSSDDNEVVFPYSNESDVGKVTAKLDKLEQDFEGCKHRYLKQTYVYIVSAIEKIRTDIVNNPNELEGTTTDIEVLQIYLKDEVDKVEDNNIGNNHNNSSDDGGDDDDDEGDKVNANEKNNIDTDKTDNNTGNDSTSNANNDKKKEKNKICFKNS